MSQLFASLFERFSRGLARVPEPFTLSLGLTLVAFGASLCVAPQTPLQLAEVWVQGLSSLLGFSMQMVLCLATGFALAGAPLVSRSLVSLCQRPRNFAESAALIAVLSLLLGALHWGLGLAGGTLLVRQMMIVNHQRQFHGPFGLLAAAGYLPLMVWHGGLSGSAPLLMATEKHFLSDQTGVIRLEQTIGHPSNLALMLILWIVLPATVYLWARHGTRHQPPEDSLPPARVEESMAPAADEPESAELKNPWLGLVTGLCGLGISGLWIAQKGFGQIGLNHINALFLFLGLLFHARLGSFLRAFRAGVMSSWSVILLFPFYGAIMAVVKESGLAAWLSQSLATWATAQTLPLWTFFSAAVLNLFVPSGGGQWVVQGPIAIAAGTQLGLAPELMIMAVAYGDQISNMLQPFWALPLLGLTRVPARELLRFSVPLMCVGGLLMLGTLALRS